MLPEGIPYIFSRLHHILFPPLSVYALLSVLDTQFPTYVNVLLYVSSLGVYIALRKIRVSIKEAREMRQLNAQRPPMWLGKYPGNVDIIGNMLEENRTGYVGDLMTNATKTLGKSFGISVLGDLQATHSFDLQMFTTDPNIVKTILATDFPGYEKGDQFKFNVKSVLGDGVFNSDGELWKFHRSMTRPFFSRERISDFELFGRHADDAISKLASRLSEGEAVDFQDLVSRFTLDSATEFLFGSNVHSLANGLPYPYTSPKSSSNSLSADTDLFANSFNNALLTIATRGRIGPIWPLGEIFKDKTAEDMKVITAFIKPIVRQAIAQKQENAKLGRDLGGNGKEEVAEGETMLSHLVKSTEDEKILVDEILNMLIAGRDTTAALLTFVVYCLARHPHVLHKLREEILTQLGANRSPTYADIREMKYLRAVINETLRLFPSVPFDLRCTTRPTTWPANSPGEKPYYIPTNTIVIYSVYIMQRSEQYWGPDALEFDPERFLDERVAKYLTPNPFVFLPFNAGPRICLGQQFAYNESSFFLIRLLQSFDEIDLASDAQPPETLPPAEWKNKTGRAATEQFVPAAHLTMYAKGGLWVRMKTASVTEDV
ncbi:cytochrome P450 monooxygenase pc-3 [Sistotremastrum niveocremeum HHB9708]|uniref:Cytochrome P450 monooxygenase pc-3 n=1 Tax=Sistotremastrum niveocremeum HHB9708 TaxID=1314777 RepID=A0A164X4Q0_9AGAM|nr:cytochrome P450 monooxygenase pc-3 [Sistotremastrum niveocremeum HHB9708]